MALCLLPSAFCLLLHGALMARDASWWLWRLLFPARCLGCGRRDHLVCPACYASVRYLPAEVCYHCCAPSPGGRLCRRCLGTPSSLASMRAACAFEGVVRKAVHAFKYRGQIALTPFLGDLLGQALARRPAAANVLVPVPLFADRLRQRGYNQAALLAHQLGARLALPVAEGALARTRATTPQVELSARERRANLRGAFACPDPSLVAGRAVLLVDDVTTTGSTLRACADALVAVGAARVMGAVVAKEL
ncbi:MAG: ComF family protein [Chloroflexi bacterium]|nr:ComF family protein [Chloroflexota bacterium]